MLDARTAQKAWFPPRIVPVRLLCVLAFPEHWELDVTRMMTALPARRGRLSPLEQEAS
jgi:hypothetical protein